MSLLRAGLLAPLLGLGLAAGAETLHVSADGTGDFPTIQAAVDAASDGDTILLGDGVFQGDGNRDIVVEDKVLTIASESGDPTRVVIDCSGSQADPHWGFDVRTYAVSPCVIEGITVVHGYKAAEQGSRWGAAVFCPFSHVRLANCIFAYNWADYGGAVSGCYGEIEIDACTFYGNGARELGGSIGFCDWVGSMMLSRCIIAFGTGGGSAYLLGSTTAECCDIYGNVGGDYDDCQGWLGVNGNICADPLFCDGPPQNYYLREDSPCVPGGECGLMGALPVGCGPTPVETGTWGAIKALYRSE